MSASGLQRTVPKTPHPSIIKTKSSISYRINFKAIEIHTKVSLRNDPVIAHNGRFIQFVIDLFFLGLWIMDDRHCCGRVIIVIIIVIPK